MTDKYRPSPEPDYPEREPLEPEPHSNPKLRAAANWRRPTSEIPLEQVAREVRAMVKQRSMWRSLAAVGGLGLGGSGAFGYHTHGHAEDLEHQVHEQAADVKQLREQLTNARIELARCCQRSVP